MTLSVVGIFGLGVVLLVVTATAVLLTDMMVLLLPVMVATAVSEVAVTIECVL